MVYGKLLRAIAAAAALVTTISGVKAADDATYPNWKGQWSREVVPGIGSPFNPGFDPTKSFGLEQNIPFTPEYQAIAEASIADQAAGGYGNFPSLFCVSHGMPLVMIAFAPIEFIVTPETTYVLINTIDHNRRIFTDGRDWPRRSSRPILAIQSAGGSMRMGMVAMTCSKSKPVVSKARAPTTQAVCRCTMTISQSSRSACTSIRGGPGCLNRISASISGASARVRLPSGMAAG